MTRCTESARTRAKCTGEVCKTAPHPEHHKKNPMDAVHKYPCVICLGTFVTSAGACDFIGLAFCFSYLADFEAQRSPWPTLEEPER